MLLIRLNEDNLEKIRKQEKLGIKNQTNTLILKMTLCELVFH